MVVVVVVVGGGHVGGTVGGRGIGGGGGIGASVASVGGPYSPPQRALLGRRRGGRVGDGAADVVLALHRHVVAAARAAGVRGRHGGDGDGPTRGVAIPIEIHCWVLAPRYQPREANCYWRKNEVTHGPRRASSANSRCMNECVRPSVKRT